MLSPRSRVGEERDQRPVPGRLDEANIAIMYPSLNIEERVVNPLPSPPNTPRQDWYAMSPA